MIISRKAFEAWLRTNPTRTFTLAPDSEYGTTFAYSCGCPLAQFAKEELKLKYPSFDGLRLFDRDSNIYHQEPWTTAFVKQFDKQRQPTATRALEILETLP